MIALNPGIYNITLDINAAGSQTSLAMRQMDSGRILKVSLRQNGQPYSIAQGIVAVFTAKKPDGTIIFNDCKIEDGLIVYRVTEQTTAAIGVVEAEIRLYDLENHMLCSPRFDIVVDATVYADDVIGSTNEFSTLTRLISEATRLINDTNAALANGDFVPTFAIGKVESLPSYEEATVTLTGTGKNPILNFGIPRGGNGSEVNHNLLLGLTLPNQHPISVITGLQDALDGKQAAGNYALQEDIPTQLSELAGDTGHRTVSDAEKQSWNGKQNALGAGDVSGSMIAPGAVSNDKLSEEVKKNIADKAPAYTSGTSALTPGVDFLASGTLYIQYE